MTTTNLNRALPSLDEDQARVLVNKLEAFYTGLSPEEQVHINLALRRMTDDTLDVSGHRLIEIGTLGWMILELVLAS